MVVGQTRLLYPPGIHQTNGVTSVVDNLVVLGSSSYVNESGQTSYGAFFQNVAGKIQTGTYTGDGTATKAITGLGWNPSGNTLIIVVPTDNSSPKYHGPEQAGDEGLSFEGIVVTSQFSSMDADGFTVKAALNVNAVVYYWFAIKETANLFQSVAYAGNATDNRNLTGAGFTPDFAFVQHVSGGSHGARFRWGAEVGDVAHYVNGLSDPNLIQAFISDGIQLGNDSTVNGGANYHALMFKSLAGHLEQKSWTGNGTGQSIALTDLNPSFALIVSDNEQVVSWIVYPPADEGSVEVEQYRLMLAETDNPDIPTLNITSQDFAARGGVLVKFERGRDAAVLGNPARAGEGTVQLLNPGLANYVLDTPAEGLAIRLNKKYDTTWYHHFQGNIRVPAHSVRPNTIDPMVTLRAIGSLSKLAGKTVSTQLYTAIGTGTAIGHVLDAADFPSHLRDLDTGDVTLPWFWANNEDALSLIWKLVHSEGITADLYEDGEGRIVFRDRSARYDESRSTNVQSTFTSAASNINIQEFVYTTGSIDGVVNEAKAVRNSRVAGVAPSVVWTDNNGDGNYIIPPNGTLKLEAIADQPFQSATTPVLNTDYASGFGTGSVALERTSGQRTLITFTAGAGGWLIGPASGNDGIQLRATETILGAEHPEISTVDASTSIAKYGRRTWQGQMYPEMEWYDMRDNLDAIVTWMKEPRGRIRVGIQAVESTQANEAVAKRELGDRIRVVESQLDFDGECWIERIEGEIRAPAASDDGDPTGWELYVYECSVVTVDASSGGSGLGNTSPYADIDNEAYIGPSTLGNQGVTTTKTIMAGAGV